MSAVLKHLLTSPVPVAGLTALVAFIVYLRTLAPTVGFIDSGELAAVACTLGVAHPTGYPLFTLIGRVFCMLPIAGEEIVRLNIMSAVFSSLGIFFFFLFLHRILGPVVDRLKRGLTRDDIQRSHVLNAVAATGSLILAFSETYWSQAVSIEVYSLHGLFLALILYTFIMANRVELGTTVRDMEPPRTSWWLLFAFTVGLSFSNHMTTILLAPGLFILYFVLHGFSHASWKRLGAMVMPFIGGLSVYLYLPIRAAGEPTLNWGYTATFERFYWHLSGKQYRVWMFSSMDSAGKQLKYFVDSLVPDFSRLGAGGEFGYIGIALALLGIRPLWRTNRKLTIGILILFVTCVFYSINYDIHDIDSYFLLAYVGLALFATAGLMWAVVRTGDWLRVRTVTVARTAIVLVAFPLGANWHAVDESKNYLVEDYTMNVLSQVDSNALILSYQWDNWLSASYYYQFVKGMRPDVAVVDKELLRRSWYLKELENRYPWLIEQSKAEVEAFSNELYKFEHNVVYEAPVIQARFVGMIRRFIERSMESRPVYVTGEIEPEFTAGLQRVPVGLAFQLVTDTSFVEVPFPTYSFRPLERAGRLEHQTLRLYANSFVERGLYYMRHGHPDEAKRAFTEALVYDPESMDAGRFLRLVDDWLATQVGKSQQEIQK
jgi:hypothetical protein